jgi:hypothetical protein
MLFFTRRDPEMDADLDTVKLLPERDPFAVILPLETMAPVTVNPPPMVALRSILSDEPEMVPTTLMECENWNRFVVRNLMVWVDVPKIRSIVVVPSPLSMVWNDSVFTRSVGFQEEAALAVGTIIPHMIISVDIPAANAAEAR